MYKFKKFSWYFFNYFALYFVPRLMACVISFPVLGIMFGVPSVFIGAIMLSFYRTMAASLQGDLNEDRSY